VSTTVNGAVALKTITIPVVGLDGKFLDTLKQHKDNDVAAIRITPQIVANGIPANFVGTSFLGTKERLKTGNVGLIGDEIYMIGYPAGLFDERNASPIWRIGIIATSPLAGYAFPEAVRKAYSLPDFIDGFLVDAHVYPGSSGSAIVIKPQPISFDNPSTISAGGAGSITYVLGLVSKSLPIADFDGRAPARLGLGIIESADAVNDTIEMFFKK